VLRSHRVLFERLCGDTSCHCYSPAFTFNVVPRKLFSPLQRIVIQSIYLHLSISMALSWKQIEKISKALGDANRLRILQHISKKGGCGQCAEIQDVIELTQPSISHHVKILTEAGLIEPEKEGRNHKYTLNEKLLAEYTEMIDNLRK
jgi:ArsR family transcriptional regulator, arsenate/arsenite/antimonite-responsive transcriptional repressor